MVPGLIHALTHAYLSIDREQLRLLQQLLLQVLLVVVQEEEEQEVLLLKNSRVEVVQVRHSP